MNNLNLWIALFVFLGSVLSVSAAALYLLLPESVRIRSIDHLVSLAIGMLLGTAFLHLLPEALARDGIDIHSIMSVLLVAILIFFVLEKTLIWRHHHSHSTVSHASPQTGDNHDASATIILLGDSFHNFLDGILIATAFFADFKLGVVTAVTVIAHEIPQELGDFAILIRAGYSRLKALFFNVLSSCAMFLGAGGAFLFYELIEVYTPYLLVFAASSFIYVAMSDLIPAMNRRARTKDLISQVLLISVGVAFVWYQVH